jgi:hypothetical protein
MTLTQLKEKRPCPMSLSVWDTTQGPRENCIDNLIGLLPTDHALLEMDGPITRVIVDWDWVRQNKKEWDMIIDIWRTHMVGHPGSSN